MRSIHLHHVSHIIHDALPWLSFQTRALVDALLLTGGAVGTADPVARRLGFPNRFGLARSLKRDGLPPLHRLTAYITVLHWIGLFERDNVSLSRLALNAGREPAAAYRLVKRLTGVPWTRVRQAGFEWVLSLFLKECGRGRPERYRRTRAAVA